MLGALPDEAERICLLHLNGLCKALKESVEAMVSLTIVSDGIMYNGENNPRAYPSALSDVFEIF